MRLLGYLITKFLEGLAIGLAIVCIVRIVTPPTKEKR